MFDVEKFINGLHSYLERAFKPVGTRLNALEREVHGLQAEVEGMRDTAISKASFKEFTEVIDGD